MEPLPGFGPAETDGRATYGVGELVGRVADAVRQAFSDEVWVVGEIRSYRPSERGGSRHIFFSLVELATTGTPAAVLPVVLWDRDRRRVNQVLTHRRGAQPRVTMGDGVPVRVCGRVELFAGRSQLQLRMTAIDPDYTLGRIESERDRVLAALAEARLVDRNRTRPLPVVPWRIGLITAPASAAAADFLHELESSGLHWQVVMAPTRVQGLSAEREVAAALEAVAAQDVDVVALVRGGGARTELAVFDTEAVARAIAAMPVPVLTGIGHEIDTSVADLVAHTAFKTPTACAAALVDRARGAADRAERALAAITSAAARRLAGAENELVLAAHRTTGRTRHRLERASHHQTQLGYRLIDQARQTTARAEARLERASATVAALDPARVLARGWTITRDGSGAVVRGVAEARRAGTLHTTFTDGSVASRVTDLEDQDG